jgi:hypothetical protein
MKFMNRSIAMFAVLSIAFVCESQAHHSFAIYDIDNKIQRTGLLTKFEFAQPHIQLVLVAELEDGSKETWEIESMALSTIITERGTTVILEEVRQRRAREDLPEVTIKHD